MGLEKSCSLFVPVLTTIPVAPEELLRTVRIIIIKNYLLLFTLYSFGNNFIFSIIVVAKMFVRNLVLAISICKTHNNY